MSREQKLLRVGRQITHGKRLAHLPFSEASAGVAYQYGSPGRRLKTDDRLVVAMVYVVGVFRVVDRSQGDDSSLGCLAVLPDVALPAVDDKQRVGKTQRRILGPGLFQIDP